MVDILSIGWLEDVFMLVGGIIGVGCLVGLIYGVRSPRFTDKLVAVNIVTTLSLNLICMLALYFKQDFILDIALIYALLSFAAVAVLAKLLIDRKGKKGDKK